MGINKRLFAKIYERCLKIIADSSDANIKNKETKLHKAYYDLCKTEDHELQEFYSIVYELRFYQYINDLGIEIKAGNDNKGGPDFITELGYIECVCPTKGESGTLERQWLDNRLKQPMNRYEAVLPRLSGAILDKRKKYKNYLDKNTIDKTKPCIIAINTSIFSNEFQSSSNLELILKILYGIGNEIVEYDTETNSFVETNGVAVHTYESEGVKPPRNIPLALNIFADKEYKNISGIILNNNAIGEELSDEFFYLLLNPVASVQIDEACLRGIKYFTQVKYDSN